MAMVLARDCGHEECRRQIQGGIEPLCIPYRTQVVATSVGAKGEFEGKQYGNWVIALEDLRDCPGVIAEIVSGVIQSIADQLDVPREHQDADWQARFRQIVLPMTQFDLDVYLSMDEDDA